MSSGGLEQILHFINMQFKKLDNCLQHANLKTLTITYNMQIEKSETWYVKRHVMCDNLTCFWTIM